MNAPNEPPADESRRDTLAYVAESLDDVRAALDTAQSAAATALTWVRIQQMRRDDRGDATPR
ncbi:MAG: hypothetical protein ACRDPQ_13995 [Nocardioidaceae bacterium]